MGSAEDTAVSFWRQRDRGCHVSGWSVDCGGDFSGFGRTREEYCGEFRYSRFLEHEGNDSLGRHVGRWHNFHSCAQRIERLLLQNLQLRRYEAAGMECASY